MINNLIGLTTAEEDRLNSMIGSVVEHFKGNYYLVLGIVNNATNADTCKQMVVYKALYGMGITWVRDIHEFLSEVDKTKYPDASQKYRFELAQGGGI